MNPPHPHPPLPPRRSSAPPPSSFLCPLSRKLMEDPVMDRCAHTFERAAIVEWIATCKCCPISRKPLSADELVPNHLLSERMDKWKWQREFHLRDDYDLEQQAQAVTVLAGDDTSVTSAASSFSDEEMEGHDVDSDDVDSDNEDHARRRGSQKKHPKTRRFSRRRLHHAMKITTGSDPLVPVEFMLLPQERQTLQSIVRAEQARLSQQQRSRCRTAVACTIAVALLIILLSVLWAAKYYFLKNNSNNSNAS